MSCPLVWACSRWPSEIARFAFLGTFLAGVFRGAIELRPLTAAAAAILLRAWLDHHRTMIAHRTAARVQETLRGRLFDKIVELGPAWFGAERTGGVMLSMVDGVEQLQSFFGQYLPQVTIALCAPLRDFRLHRVVGRAGRDRHAGGCAVYTDPAGHRAPEDGTSIPRATVGVQVVRRGIP